MIKDSLKQLRLSAGYDQQYLALKLGISQGHISHLETGKINPTIQILELYASFFNRTSIDETISKLFE